MKKNGFTLTELLAIIVLIGVVGGIIIPSTIGLLRKSKIKAFEVSIEGYLKAIDTDNTDRGGLSNNYTITNGKVFHVGTGDEIRVSNNTEEDGEIEIDRHGVIIGKIFNEKYCAVRDDNLNINNIIEGNCP